MSINVIGTALPIDVDAQVTLSTLSLTPATHQIEGTESQPLDVQATLAVRSLTALTASAQNSLTVTPGIVPNVPTADFDATVDAQTGPVDTNVTASTAGIIIMGNNAVVVGTEQPSANLEED